LTVLGVTSPALPLLLEVAERHMSHASGIDRGRTRFLQVVEDRLFLLGRHGFAYLSRISAFRNSRFCGSIRLAPGGLIHPLPALLDRSSIHQPAPAHPASH
jgi:hypothetical protein